ncbi:MAG: PDZ domain-containing protein [Gammaproteobacteria bacterium]
MRYRLVLLISLLGSLLPISHSQLAASSPHRAWLGVVAVEVSFERLAALGLEYGVEVTQVVPKSPAAKAGLRPGDVILAIAERPAYSVNRLSWLIDTLTPGQPVPIECLCAGEKKTLKVELSSPPPRGEPFGPGEHGYGPQRSYLGVGLQGMTDDLRQAFGVPRDVGVLVTEVFDGSPAAAAGLAAGDVITQMDRKRIGEVDDVYRVLDFFEPGDEIAIEIVREKASQRFTVVLATPPDQDSPRPWFRPSDSPPRIPAPFLEPHYWQRQLDDLLERWREYWRKESEGYPPFERRLQL